MVFDARTYFGFVDCIYHIYCQKLCVSAHYFSHRIDCEEDLILQAVVSLKEFVFFLLQIQICLKWWQNINNCELWYYHEKHTFLAKDKLLCCVDVGGTLTYILITVTAIWFVNFTKCGDRCAFGNLFYQKNNNNKIFTYSFWSSIAIYHILCFFNRKLLC